MINYIKYSVNGVTYDLIDNGDGTWSVEENAPSVAGNYSLIIEISENGIVSYIDASDPKYNVYLDVIVGTERVVFLQDYLPDFIKELSEIEAICETENLELDRLHAEVAKVKSDMFIDTASNDAITRIESYIRTKGQGTLDQRKSFIKSLKRKGSKLSETVIKNIANAITGSDCILAFFASDELNNPDPGYSLLRVQVLSPDNNKDYRYSDIARALKPLVPSHVKLIVIKYFATWNDTKSNFTDWNSIKSMNNWTAVKNYIPPQ